MSLVWSPGFNGVTDPDAQTYIAAVEAADGQAIEGNVAYAINDFVVGCKTDGIWDAIKASCILAGARTLSGALVPLKGTAPTNVNFVSGDYDRETGLATGGSNKYLNSNRGNATDPQNDQHMALYASTANTGTLWYMGAGESATGSTHLFSSSGSNLGARNRNSTADNTAGTNSAGFIGMSRDNSSSYVVRGSSTSSTISRTSETPYSGDIHVFQVSGSSLYWADGRFTFYSIGEAIDLEKLDTRTTRLMNLLSYSLASGLPALSSMDIDAALYIGAVYRAGGTLS